jgi:hypothetical protein
MVQVQVFGIDETIAELKMLDENLVKDLRKDLTASVRPIAQSIKAYIPSQPPLMGRSSDRNGGMNHNGRTAWNKSAVKVSVRTSFTRKTARNESSIVSIRVGGKGDSPGSAALQIADMAGRRNRTRTGTTRSYAYKGGTRTHTLNGQGRAMIDYLNSRRGSSSRFVWRAANLQLPAVQAAVLVSLENAGKKVSARLVTK